MRKTIFSDDLTGQPIDDPDFKPTKLALNGVMFEIDLDTDSFAKLEKALGKFLKNAREVTTHNSSKPTAQRVNPETKKIREWARANGLEVADRGRIDNRIVEAYHKQDVSIALANQKEDAEGVDDEIEDDLEELV